MSDLVWNDPSMQNLESITQEISELWHLVQMLAEILVYVLVIYIKGIIQSKLQFVKLFEVWTIMHTAESVL